MYPFFKILNTFLYYVTVCSLCNASFYWKPNLAYIITHNSI